MGDRQAVENPDVLARGECSIGGRGTLPGELGHERDDRIDRGIDPLDLCQMRLEQLDRRELAVAQQPGLLDGRQVAEIGHGRNLPGTVLGEQGVHDVVAPDALQLPIGAQQSFPVVAGFLGHPLGGQILGLGEQ